MIQRGLPQQSNSLAGLQHDLTNAMNFDMCKGFTSACVRAKAALEWKSILPLLFLELGLTCLASAQTQVGTWEDRFRNRSRIASASNVDIDTTSGAISLKSSRDSVSTASNFRVVLSGIDRSFIEPTGFNVTDVVDVDSVPGEPDVFLVTDARNRWVFTYNTVSGSTTSINFVPGIIASPVDAFYYRESGRDKVLITDATNGIVVKVSTSNLDVQWRYNISSQPLLQPRDAVALPNRPEVLICDSGNNRLLSVDTTTTGPGAIQWQFGAGEFNIPWDVDVLPNDPDVYLVTDKHNHRVVQVRRSTSQIIWQFGIKGQPDSTDSTLTFPEDADPLPNGDILISDTGNKRLIAVNQQGKIVYRFAHPLFDLKDADRIASGPHRDKTIIASKVRSLDSRIIPRRLAYSSESSFISQPQIFPRPVDFDVLRLQGITPPGTRIRLQLRTVNDLSDTTMALWYGPTSTSDYYENPVTATNPNHNGNRIYQFRAFLDTNSPLLTPELQSVRVDAHYFRSDSEGVVVSAPVRDAADAIITAWSSLSFTTNLPAVSGGGTIRVDILDGITSDSLLSFPATQSGNQFDIAPPRYPILRGRQSLRLRAVLRTQNPSVSPQLLNWGLAWNFVKLEPSEISFANAGFQPVSDYRLGGSAQDLVYITLTDPNAQALRDSVSVTVRSTRIGDTEDFFLKVTPPATREAFRSIPGISIAFAGVATLGNRRLEVSDRDTLHVTYTDPLDASDQSRASALIIRRVTGTIQIENVAGARIDSVSIGDSLYVRVLGETDQNLSPTARDSIAVSLFNGQTNDSESLILREIANGSGVFDTGNFRNLRGIPIVKEGALTNNGRIAARGGDFITARYTDPHAGDSIEDDVAVRIQPDTTITILDGEAFNVIIAPNPYRARAQQNRQLNLRAEVQSGQMTIRQIEIYNLAGEKIRTIAGERIRFEGNTTTISSTQRAVDASAWWDLRDDSNASIASGTYIAKFIVRLSDGNRVEEVSMLRKFVVIQ
jgi:hypothetical protein